MYFFTHVLTKQTAQTQTLLKDNDGETVKQNGEGVITTHFPTIWKGRSSDSRWEGEETKKDPYKTARSKGLFVL